MEGQLLSTGPAADQDAAVLRNAFSYRRDQLHVLPDADGKARYRMGRSDPVTLQADPEGSEAHHARQPPQELRSAAGRLLRRGRLARRQARGAPVSTPAEREEGSACL